MASSAPTSPLRQVLENQFSQLSAEVERLFDAARSGARNESAEQLNQAVRRIRQAATLEELGATLLDAASAFAEGAALFRIADEAAKGDGIRGVPEQAAEAFRTLEIPLSSAAALGGAAATRDPVIAVTTPAEVSQELVGLAGHPPDGRASVFPIVAADRVAALVYAWGAVQGAAIELLTQVAAAVWPAGATGAAETLVIIEPAPPASAWDRLPAEEQQVHLRAQRFARVQVAEMRLSEPGRVQSGRAHRDLYESLRQRIDSAREAFRQSFFVPCSSMVDYLHLELVRTLAHDDPELLGKDYPGPLV